VTPPQFPGDPSGFPGVPLGVRGGLFRLGVRVRDGEVIFNVAVTTTPILHRLARCQTRPHELADGLLNTGLRQPGLTHDVFVPRTAQPGCLVVAIGQQREDLARGGLRRAVSGKSGTISRTQFRAQLLTPLPLTGRAAGIKSASEDAAKTHGFA
jgi:hypothetical protein